MLLTHVFLLLSLQNKLKKIKEKYKDQDEEDRELMMQLLGARVNRTDSSTRRHAASCNDATLMFILLQFDCTLLSILTHRNTAFLH